MPDIQQKMNSITIHGSQKLSIGPPAEAEKYSASTSAVNMVKSCDGTVCNLARLAGGSHRKDAIIGLQLLQWQVPYCLIGMKRPLRDYDRAAHTWPAPWIL